MEADAAADLRFDVRFDPNFALTLLLELGRERSVQGLVEKLAGAILRRPGPFARVEIWLIREGDICSHCPQRPQCPDQTRCLHLVGSRNSLLPGSLDTTFPCAMRMPLGVGIVGKIAATGQEVLLKELDHVPAELSPAWWLQREQVRAFTGSAISFKGEVLGVLGVFTRLPAVGEVHAWRDVFTQQIGGAVANARAFEEIQRLKMQLELQNDYLKEEVVEAKAFGQLVGQSAALRHMISQIDLVAATDASVLILGETGTGKELVAHEIHNRSRRQDKPLVRVNCASIPKDLFESEFFGHTRGAFTGAVKDRAGRFEAAEGGTIFLDEIGEVPMELQSKLLRVLQEKRYERVGEDRTRLADVRIIGATNRDLKKEVTAGRFREDLYYRLNVFPIHVTPLRERVEDIPLLAKHFVELSVKELRCAKPRLTRAGAIKLQSYDWPGNIRELRNVIERAVIISRGGVLDFDLPAGNSLPAAYPETPPAGSEGEPEIFTEPEMQRRERENVLAALTKTNWKIRGADGAAELLGLKPTTLVTRMQRMGLKRPD